MSEIEREISDEWRFSECGAYASRSGVIYVIDGSQLRLTEYPAGRVLVAIEPGCNDPTCKEQHLGLAYVLDKSDIKSLISAVQELAEQPAGQNTRKIMH